MMLALVLAWLILAAITGLVAWRKGISLNGGCLLGLLLPVVGLAIILLMKPRNDPPGIGRPR